ERLRPVAGDTLGARRMVSEAASGWSGRLVRNTELPVDLRPAWRLDDPEIEQDAIAFWSRLSLLGAGTDPARRAKELVAAAYQSDRLVGVATAWLERLEQLRGRFAVYRCAVDPDSRRHLVSTALTVFARDVLERWSVAHPGERVLGLAAVIESRSLVERQKYPVWENTGLNLVGYDRDGRQVRVAWFAHARVDPD
ncbi:MAG: hypothetical protein ACXWU1_12860, partial [Allosphingosinicella sp.]